MLQGEGIHSRLLWPDFHKGVALAGLAAPRNFRKLMLRMCHPTLDRLIMADKFLAGKGYFHSGNGIPSNPRMQPQLLKLSPASALCGL